MPNPDSKNPRVYSGSIKRAECLRFLRRPQKNLAHKRLRSLGHQHGYDVRHVVWLEHLRGVLAGVRA
jgi:hypothetical protein